MAGFCALFFFLICVLIGRCFKTQKVADPSEDVNQKPSPD